MKIGYGITGSFCNHHKSLIELEKLCQKYDVKVFVSDKVINTDTRFGTYKELKRKVEELTKSSVVESITEAELYGPKIKLDLMMIVPCTASTLGKLANGIYDNAVLLAAKAHLRGNHPLVLAIASNDLLGSSFESLAKVYKMKNIYFVPFGQDDYVNKPNSLVANFSLLEETINKALEGKQIQPVLYNYNERND